MRYHFYDNRLTYRVSTDCHKLRFCFIYVLQVQEKMENAKQGSSEFDFKAALVESYSRNT